MDEFEELGLTKNEGKVYSTLIKFGKLSAGETSARSEVPYSRIYDVLESLVHKGLIEIVPEKTKKFIPTSPDAFLKVIEQKEQMIAKAREKVKELKQFYSIKEKHPVVVGEGQKAFYKIIKEGKEPENYSYSIKWTSEYRDDWARDNRRRIKERKDIKVLTRYDKETEKDIKKWLKINKNIKKIGNEGVAIGITDDEEVVLGLIKSNVTLLIKDEPFAKVMKKLFLETYKSAEQVK